MAGSYTVRLIVNDGQVNSLADSVVVTASATANLPPVARAGLDQAVSVGQTVTLDGRGSSDPDGDPLTYRWSFLSRPAGSAAALSNPAAAQPTFMPDVAGDFVARLVVNDGTVYSRADTVVIAASAANLRPVARAGLDQVYLVGQTVTLDGRTSRDPDADPLTYAWSFVSRPVGSTATLASRLTAQPTFVADVAGDFVVRLVVNDGTVNSLADTVVIEAIVSNARPAPPTSRGQYRTDGVTRIALGGMAPQVSVQMKGTVTDPNGGTAKMQVEVKPVGTAFTGTVSCQSAFVASGTVAACTVGGLVRGRSYHWRTRTVDSLGAVSAWASYATNAETAADFVVNRVPAVPTARGQRQADGITPIPLGGTVSSATAVFLGTVSDPNTGQTIRLQVEVKPVGTAFTGAVSCQSALVSSGTATKCSVTGLTAGRSYHWRLRAVDSLGAASAWASYATNAETAPDFIR
jgi:hypothetical protein